MNSAMCDLAACEHLADSENRHSAASGDIRPLKRTVLFDLLIVQQIECSLLPYILLRELGLRATSYNFIGHLLFSNVEQTIH